MWSVQDNLILLKRNNFSWSYFFPLENRTFKKIPQDLRLYSLVYTVKYSVITSCCYSFLYDIHDKCLQVADICFTMINFMHHTDFVSIFFLSVQFRSVHSPSHVWLFATPWTIARQASLSITSYRSSPKPMSMESVMPSNHLILCRPLLLLSSIFPSIRVFSNESALCIGWPKY